MKIIRFDSIDSTFSEAGRAAPGLGGGEYLFLADGQTAGRGRGGNSFASPRGNGIYATLLIIRDFGRSDTAYSFYLTSLAAVCVTRAVAAVTGLDRELSVKPVNDLYFRGKKYGGILCASDVTEGSTDSVRIGFGVNLGDAPLPDVATSLRLGRAGGREVADASERIAILSAAMMIASVTGEATAAEVAGCSVPVLDRAAVAAEYDRLCRKYTAEHMSQFSPDMSSFVETKQKRQP